MATTMMKLIRVITLVLISSDVHAERINHWENATFDDYCVNRKRIIQVMTEANSRHCECGRDVSIDGFYFGCQQLGNTCYNNGVGTNESFVSTMSAFTGAETFQKCISVYGTSDEVQQDMEGHNYTHIYLGPRISIPESNPPFDDDELCGVSENKEGVQFCIEGQTTGDGNVQCMAKINDQPCRSCTVSPCHIFFRNEYSVDCENVVVRGTSVFDTCTRSGMDNSESFAYYWDAQLNDYDGVYTVESSSGGVDVFKSMLVFGAFLFFA